MWWLWDYFRSVVMGLPSFSFSLDGILVGLCLLVFIRPLGDRFGNFVCQVARIGSWVWEFCLSIG